MTSGVYERTTRTKQILSQSQRAIADQTRRHRLAWWTNKRKSKFPGVQWDGTLFRGKGAWRARLFHNGKERKKAFPATEDGEKDAAQQYQEWLDEVRHET